ncbi:MAG: murein biosynthesis integral membrane protein MurJ [Actinobacteria bacterium]|nr:murein biosynthesis integral membrane protein MurJ [Actinomycetota bacterium]
MSAENTVKQKSSVFKATFLVMTATALSRILGYVREVVVAAYYGTSLQVDAYRVAVQLPNLFRLVIGDVVIAAAFVPIFSAYLAKGEEEEAWKVASKILTMTFVSLFAVSLLGIIFAKPLISLLAPGFNAKPETMDLSILLARIMFPALIFMALSGILSGMLNSYEIFFLPAVSPTVWNLIIISGIVLFSGQYGILAFSVSLLIASIVQAIVQLPGFKNRLRYFRFDLDARHPEVRNFFLMLIPIVLSSATSNINTIVDTRFASYLQTGVIAALGYAIRIYLVPAGVFGVAIATVLFPKLAKYETIKDESSFIKSLSFGLRVLTFVITPVASFFVFFALPIVRILFERGNFTYSDSLLTAAALSMYSIGVVSYSQMTLLSRAYYSKKDASTPLYIALISIVVNYFGDWFLMRTMPKLVDVFHFLKPISWLFQPHAGIALSTSIVSIFQFAILYFLYSVKHGRIEGRKFLQTSIKSLLATAAALISGWSVYNLIGAESKLSILIGVFGALASGFVVYLLAALLLRMEEIKFVSDLIKERFRKART